MLPFYRAFFLSCIYLLLLASILSGCAGKAKKASIPSPLPSLGKPSGDHIERGIASWYGYPYHGRKTANGEIYDMYKLTAAHRTLPLGTWVYVTNLENGRVLKVRINDRGPFIEGRIIDLSYTGAVTLGFARAGITRVAVSIAEPASLASFQNGRFAIQVGAFKIRSNAQNLKYNLEKSYSQVYIEQYYEFYRVRIGGYFSKEAADKEGERLVAQGFTPFIVRQD